MTQFDPYPDGSEPPSGIYKTSTDVVQEQTRRRILRENETYLQQQERLKREKREALFCGALVLLGVLFVLVAQIYKEVHR